MNLSSAINSFKRHVKITRQYQGVYADGDYVEGSKRDFYIDAVVQPANPRTLETVMQGERADGAIQIHSLQALNIGGLQDAPSDVLTVDGYSYRLKAENNHFGNGQFYSYIAVKVGQ